MLRPCLPQHVVRPHHQPLTRARCRRRPMRGGGWWPGDGGRGGGRGCRMSLSTLPLPSRHWPSHRWPRRRRRLRRRCDCRRRRHHQRRQPPWRRQRQRRCSSRLSLRRRRAPRPGCYGAPTVASRQIRCSRWACSWCCCSESSPRGCVWRPGSGGRKRTCQSRRPLPGWAARRRWAARRCSPWTAGRRALRTRHLDRAHLSASTCPSQEATSRAEGSASLPTWMMRTRSGPEARRAARPSAPTLSAPVAAAGHRAPTVGPRAPARGGTRRAPLQQRQPGLGPPPTSAPPTTTAAGNGSSASPRSGR